MNNKLNIFILFVVLYSILTLYKIYKNQRKNTNITYTIVHDKNNILENINNKYLENHGKNIKTNIPNKISKPTTNVTTNINTNVTTNINTNVTTNINTNETTNINTNVIINTNINKNETNNNITGDINNNNYNIFINRINSIVIGRYDIKDIETINYISECVNQYVRLSVPLHKIKSFISNEQYMHELIQEITLEISRNLINIIKDPIKKIMIAQYIIRYTSYNSEIEKMYNCIVEIASNRNYSEDTRMNAVDVLLLSNNTRYNSIANSLLESNRNIKNKNLYNLKLDKLSNGIRLNHPNNNPNNKLNNNINNKLNNNINNKLNNNINNTVNNNVNQINNILNNITNNNVNNRLLVDVNGNTYNIPPDIDTPPPNKLKKPERSVYEDGQNVHNSTINDTTLNTALELISNYSPNNTIEFVDYNFLPEEYIKKINISIHRLSTDTSIFRHNITLYKLYKSLLCFIEQHKDKNDLYKRLREELIDMSGKCATGHLSRLVNVLQGFETDLSNKVILKIDDEVYAKIKHIIEKEIQENENMDDIMDDMLSDDKVIYLNFIKNVINKHLNEICKEYSKSHERKYVIECIINSLNKYTGTKDKFNNLI